MRILHLTVEYPIDYVRYVAPTDKLWVTEPNATPSGIAVFALGATPAATPTRAGFIPVPGDPEALTLASRSRTVYTHADRDLVAIAIDRRSISARWPTGCTRTHGFPQLDERHGLALASCASDGRVSLLNLHDSRQLGRYQVGGHESLPAYSSKSHHFYVRGDPGTQLVTLQASRDGLEPVDHVAVPRAGHCLTADDQGHYWTCDADHGRVLQFHEPRHQAVVGHTGASMSRGDTPRLWSRLESATDWTPEPTVASGGRSRAADDPQRHRPWRPQEGGKDRGVRRRR